MNPDIVPWMDLWWARIVPRHNDVLGGGHEPGLIDSFPSGGRVVLDVGAHIGLYTLPLARRFEKIYAFEPDPEARRTLKINLLLNELEENVEVIPHLAWDSSEQITLHLRPGRSSFHDVPESSGDLEVWGFPIDQQVLPEDRDRIDLIKIDVEGTEEKVLRGAQEVLASSHPFLCVEMHDYIYPVNVDVIAGLLTDHGYTWEDRPYNADVHHWLAQ